jgi:hypothetical protein
MTENALILKRPIVFFFVDVFFSGEGLEPRPFVRFARVIARFFSSDHRLHAFAIFKVIDLDLNPIFKVERSRNKKNRLWITSRVLN